MKHLAHIQVKAKATLGLINRITNMVRKRNYDMEDMSVSFDEHNIVTMDMLIDQERYDIQQLADQVHKLYEVYEVMVYPAEESIKYAIYVTVDNQELLHKIDVRPSSINAIHKARVARYMIVAKQKEAFCALLRSHDYHFKVMMVPLV